MRTDTRPKITLNIGTDNYTRYSNRQFHHFKQLITLNIQTDNYT